MAESASLGASLLVVILIEFRETGLICSKMINEMFQYDMFQYDMFQYDLLQYERLILEKIRKGERWKSWC